MTALDHDVELSAVVAHGLLNTLAVLSGSAATIRQYGDRLSSEQRESMTDALVSHSQLIAEGLDVLLRHCSDAFAEAAAVVDSIGRRFRAAVSEDRAAMLERLDTASAVLRSGLQSLVLGLPADTRELLDSLQRP